MNILVERNSSYGESTISSLSIDGVFNCFVCEDVVRAEGEKKIHGKTAIPAGTYRVIINKSSRFSAMKGRDVFLPLLLDLPGKVTMFGSLPLSDCGIRIHTGNTAADTEGCLLLGRKINPDRQTISESKLAFDPFFAKLQAALARKEQVLITIKNPALFV